MQILGIRKYKKKIKTNVRACVYGFFVVILCAEKDKKRCK